MVEKTGIGKSRVHQFVSSNEHLGMLTENGIKYIEISPSVNSSDIDTILELLWDESFEMAFHDTVHPTISDPGAYFSYSTEKSTGKEFWSMIYGNHGWSGGIYHINSSTVSKQLLNLVSNSKLDKLQITEVIFFSWYETEKTKKSIAKDLEISQMHD